MVIRWFDTEVANGSSDPPKLRAAEYVRMSTEHQQYSTDNQSEAICNLLNSARVVRHLAQHHSDLLTEFQKIAELQMAA